MPKDQKIIDSALTKAFQTLNFTEAEIKENLDNIDRLEQIGVFSKVIGLMTKEELAAIGAQTGEQQQQALLGAVKKHLDAPGMQAKIESVRKKVLEDSISGLLKLGDKNQQTQVSGILLELMK